MDIVAMYVKRLMSITEISAETGKSRSAVRYGLRAAGVLRSRADGVRLAASRGRIGKSLKGSKRVFSQAWKDNISAGMLRRAEEYAAGISLKPNGYIEITRGPNKGRLQHVLVMEGIIGRRLFANEIVHHIDEDRSNNDPKNLELMTRAAHSRLHALQNATGQQRNKDGKFK